MQKSIFLRVIKYISNYKRNLGRLFLAILIPGNERGIFFCSVNDKIFPFSTLKSFVVSIVLPTIPFFLFFPQGLTIIIDLGSSTVKAGFARENGIPKSFVELYFMFVSRHNTERFRAFPRISVLSKPFPVKCLFRNMVPTF